MIYLFVILFVVLDQVTKCAASKYLIHNSIKIFDWFKLDYVENRGAAFGFLDGKQTFFIVVTVFVLVFLAFFIYKYYSSLSTLEVLASILLFSGAIGNLIDRVVQGYVVDFISVRIFNVYDFPVFNFADIYVTFAVIVYLISVLKYERS